MKITKSYLRKVINEEINKLEEIHSSDLENYGAAGMSAMMGAGALINPMINLGTGGTIAAVAAVLSPFIQRAVQSWMSSKEQSVARKQQNVGNLKEQQNNFNLEQFRREFISALKKAAKARPELTSVIQQEIKAEQDLYEQSKGNVDIYMKEIANLGKYLAKK